MTPKKQQILEIRRPKVRNGANSKQSDFDDETTPPPSLLVATPPKQVLTQQHQPSPKPSPNRPVLPKQSDPTPMTSSETVGALDADPYEEAVESVSETQELQDSLAVEELGNDLTSGAEQKQLSSPRALAQPPSRPQQQNHQSASRPVLKRSKPEPGIAEERSSTEVVGKPIRAREQAPAVVEAKENKPPRRENPTKPKPVADLQRPQPPRKSAPPAIAIAPNKRRNDEVAAERTEDDEEIELESGPGTELLQRPTLPRPAKKTQVWEEDDEESGDFPSKAKAAKTKRTGRVKPTIDEDEDLVDDDLDIPTPVIVSLSLARPAKPKSAAAKPVAALLTTSYAKAKKPAPGQGSSSSGQKSRGRQSAEAKEERPVKLVLMGTMTVQELASTLAVPETEIIRRLFARGIAVNITQTLDIPTIHQVAEELGVEVETAEKEAEAKKLIEMLDEADLENLHRRPPVVTIMGHVDHGKTTLLDSIRKTKVAQGEAGGITQHIGAYHVDVEHDGKTQQVVFLDTPGHEAFTAMRARGARVTDIAILVVAADDGVRPQTIEAISHAKAAKVPIIIAINKIDKEEAQPERVKQELTEYGLVAEEWGGETIVVPVSAIRGENLDTLLEMILLVAEVEDLNANPNRAAKGTVIEAHLDKARGPVATLLVQNGTLRVGDIIVAGSALGKVRAMIDDRFQRVEVASPSFAVEVLGLREVPRAGDEFDVFQNEKEASAIAAARAAQARQSRLLQGSVSLSAFSQQAKEGELKELNLILKADVQGSLEAIVGALRQLPQREVQLRLLLAAPGEITETDIDLASASNGVILGFNTTFASGARQAADQAGVDVREYNIIYKLLDDVQGAMEGLLEPELVEEALGSVEVRTVFPISRGAVAGCYVLSGKAIRNCKVRVRRGNNVIHEGILDSLKRMKDDVKEVNAGYECGISLNAFSDWVEGDIIEAYRMVTKRRTLSS